MKPTWHSLEKHSLWPEKNQFVASKESKMLLTWKIKPDNVKYFREEGEIPVSRSKTRTQWDTKITYSLPEKNTLDAYSEDCTFAVYKRSIL